MSGIDSPSPTAPPEKPLKKKFEFNQQAFRDS